MEEESARRLLEENSGSNFDTARLQSLRAKSAGAYLDGTPSNEGGALLIGEEFRSRAGRRLGVQLCEEGMCSLCGQVMDRFGAHAEGCMCGGDAARRHKSDKLSYLQAMSNRRCAPGAGKI